MSTYWILNTIPHLPKSTSKRRLWEGLTLKIEGDLVPSTTTIHTVYRPKVLSKLEDLMQNTKYETCISKDPNINHTLLSDIIDTAMAEIPQKRIKITK